MAHSGLQEPAPGRRDDHVRAADRAAPAPARAKGRVLDDRVATLYAAIAAEPVPRQLRALAAAPGKGRR
jgi:hypothetical protein